MNWSNCRHVFSDENKAILLQSKMHELILLIHTYNYIGENNAHFIAIEVGCTDLIVHRYSSMKIMQVTLQSKLDELILFFHTYMLMKITRTSLQWKLDELILLFHTYLLMKIKRISLQSTLDELIQFSTRIVRKKYDFHCNRSWIYLIFPHVSVDESIVLTSRPKRPSVPDFIGCQEWKFQKLAEFWGLHNGTETTDTAILASDMAR